MFLSQMTFYLGGYDLSVLYTTAQLTEGRSARDQRKQPPAKKRKLDRPFLSIILNVQLLSLLQTISTTAKTRWPVGYMMLVGSERSCSVLYLGNPDPKLFFY